MENKTLSQYMLDKYHLCCYEVCNVKKKITLEVPLVAQQVRNPTRIHEDTGLLPGLA